MKYLFLTLGVVAVLSACGGGRKSSTVGYRQPVLYATGPIYSSCLKLNKQEASRARCGCVQAVADMSLSGSDQRKGAAFYRDPQKAQETRQSDNAANERFWLKWRDFGAQAERYCRGT